MKVCVLQPDYSNSNIDYKNYDPPRDLSGLLTGSIVDHVFLNKLTVYRQLSQLKRNHYDIFVNLCEGDLTWDVPSIDVVHSLEMLNLPYTGPEPYIYNPTKTLMKYVAYLAGVATPPYVIIQDMADLHRVEKTLSYPVFLKPLQAGDSMGIDDRSLVFNQADLFEKAALLLREFNEVLAEAYIEGREFTVLVAAGAGKNEPVSAYDSIEFIFPPGKTFKTYALKTSELHPESNIPCSDPQLNRELKRAATNIFTSFNGVGYARLDFRVDSNGTIFFLEINFACSVFYSNGYEGSADYILHHHPNGQSGFLRHIIREGISRHEGKQKKFYIDGNAIAGYGIYAKSDIPAGEIVLCGEEKPREIVTRRHIYKTWQPSQQENFRRYAYPLSSEVFCLWSSDPDQWAPQNHCCDPNTRFEGLDVVALEDIAKGDELTIDYATFLDETMEPFACACGAAECRKHIEGVKGNSVAARERAKD